jgi:cell division protein ZapD
MQLHEDQGATASEVTQTIVYEQPLNERMRTFLRLNFLYRQFMRHMVHEDDWSTRAAVSALLDILAMTSRSDIRNDSLKELERQIAALAEFQTRPGVDATRLRGILTKLEKLRSDLTEAGILAMQRVRDSEFLTTIKQRSITGGACEFDVPDYFHWLSQPYEVRAVSLQEWHTAVRPLCDAISEALFIARQTARPRKEMATNGGYQVPLEKDTPCQLIRVTLPLSSRLYPEISGSHRRASIRFLEWRDVNARATQTTQDVSFWLTICT